MDLQKFKDGDEANWKEVYNLYFDQLVKYSIRRYCLLYEDACDMVLDSLVNLFKNRKYIRNQSDIRASIFTYVRRRAIDKWRTSQRIRISLHYNIEQLFASEEDEFMDHRNNYEPPNVMPLLPSLPTQQKTVVEMRIAGEETGEIAEKLHLSPQTVLNHFTLGIKALRKKLNYNPTH
jgi:RNA polymerase sigma-19 factor, ECF subfamily